MWCLWVFGTSSKQLCDIIQVSGQNIHAHQKAHPTLEAFKIEVVVVALPNAALGEKMPKCSSLPQASSFKHVLIWADTADEIKSELDGEMISQ